MRDDNSIESRARDAGRRRILDCRDRIDFFSLGKAHMRPGSDCAWLWVLTCSITWEAGRRACMIYIHTTKLDQRRYGSSAPSDVPSRSTGLKLVLCRFQCSFSNHFVCFTGDIKPRGALENEFSLSEAYQGRFTPIQDRYEMRIGLVSAC